MTTEQMTSYRISSKSGADFGTYEGSSPASALAAMHRDAGYDVLVDPDSGRLAFPDDETRELCGDVDEWDIEVAEAAVE